MTNDVKKHMLLLYIGLGLAGILHSVCGTATTTLNCTEPGFKGKSYNITCHTKGNISSGIVWIGPNDRSVAGCKPSGECVPNAGYKSSVKGTQYMLHIYTLEERDAGTWKCTDGASDSNTGTCSLNFSSHPSEMNCSISKPNVSTLTFDLDYYYCSNSTRFQLLSSNGLSCDVKPSSNRQIVNGRCGVTNNWSGTVYPVMSCGGHKFNLTCHLALGTTGNVSGARLHTANKVCVGWLLVVMRLILYKR